MAYDLELAERVRSALDGTPDVAERTMFGGLAFLVGGSMAVAVSGGGGLMVRCAPALADELVTRDGVARMVMQGRELAGWVLVDPATLDDVRLPEYVAAGVGAAREA
ncbi:TfoX/Sxy family protein [Klenkia brasiliensis]|uniref:TfoX N-terminal domain-containing protein n=1 Tax=Klenkia brasiliensis TaxID=333142 RepID=A0A1G7N8D9_9ACTN|nr:TfoX/Sxy family protein [Klenkia brasiliensis]SDF70206.1 TfoX N-terminal domain-containing protein [Klenkia brasiliensis]